MSHPAPRRGRLRWHIPGPKPAGAVVVLGLLMAAGVMAESGSAGTAAAGAKSDLYSTLSAADGIYLEGNGCASCHRMERVFTHPVGVVPSMQVPTEFPLEAGRMTCLTCHEDADASAHILARERGDRLLRNGEADFCTKCHQGGASSRAMHATVGWAHLAARRQIAGDGVRAALDEESQTCLSCHDGTLAKDVGIGQESGFGEHGKGHPVGISYGRGSDGRGRAGVEAPLVPRPMLDQRIRLFDERVGCGSCHSPYSGEDGLLVMSNHRSRLCLSCHRE